MNGLEQLFQQGQKEIITKWEDCIRQSVQLAAEGERQPSQSDSPQFGDILGINRGLYQHYAVYVGKGRVIHYAGAQGDFDNSSISIHGAPLKEFMDGQEEYFICRFPERYQRPKQEKHMAMAAGCFPQHPLASDFLKMWRSFCYKVYSPEETVSRAYSRLGETNYNLLTNNCEHFAIWCKTNLSESWQINDLLEVSQKPHLYVR